MVASQGEIWWAELGNPIGSAPGYRRPVLVVQADVFNRSRIGTIVCVPFTTNLRWADAPGNVLFKARETGLDRDSVVNASGIVALDRTQLHEHVGQVSRHKLNLVFDAIDAVLGR